MNDEKESDVQRPEKSIPGRGYKFDVSRNRKISLMGRESRILQGFVNQEKEFGFYSKEALLRVMSGHLSQKAAAEVVEEVRW